MTLSYKEVAEILKIIDASDCQEVILELEGTRLVVRRGDGAAAPTAPAASPAPVAAQASAPAAKASSHAAAPAAADSAGGTIIRAPMVGTFYRRPAPGQPPFVEVGSKIKAGDALCLIEVMKLYTTIEATAEGTVAQIAAEDGQLVEFNQPLFTIKAA